MKQTAIRNAGVSWEPEPQPPQPQKIKPNTATIVHGLPNDEYHGCKWAVSNSGLGAVLQSPLHYYARNLDPNRPPERERAGQLEGNIAHCAILEPDEFGKRYRIVPADAPRRPSVTQRNAKKPSEDTIHAIHWWDQWEADTGGATIITADQYEVAMRQSDSVRRLPQIADYLASGHAELSAFWRDEETQVYCRVRPDWTHRQGNEAVILDVKTFADASARAFARQAARKGYHRQDAMYSDGYAASTLATVSRFVFVVVEPEWPFAANAIELDEASRHAGHQEYRRALGIYAQCKRENVWPGYSDKIEEASLPAYVFYEQEDEPEVTL
jgi:hypothetical protein